MPGKMEERTYATGEVIISQGAHGSEMFAIVSGSAHVLRAEPDDPLQEKLLAELGEGASPWLSICSPYAPDYRLIHGDAATAEACVSVLVTLRAGSAFGERALLKKEPRFATVVARTPLQAFTITRDRFTEVLGPLSELVKSEYI